jgi:hypothetical protein
MDCTTIADATEYLACAGEFTAPILDAAASVVAVAVLIAVIFAGVRLAKRIVKEFGR